MRFQVMNLRQIMIITVVIFILSISCDRIDSFATAQGRTWSILPSKLKHTNIIRTSKNKNDNENDKKKYNNHHHIRSEDNNDVDSQMMYISFFAFLHQASMPLADLIDGAFLSDMDASSLGAMGVARSCQNSVSRLFNSPLSKTTISAVASASGKQSDEEDELSQSVSSALAVALTFGMIQTFVFILGATQMLWLTGIDTNSDMYLKAFYFMKARALSATPATLWLVSTNVFRGLGDATSPLICALFFNMFNFCSDYILIKRLRLGIVGASLASSFAQTVTLTYLLSRLNRHVKNWSTFDLPSFLSYVSKYGKAGIFLLGRSTARIAVVSYCSRCSALLGAVPASSYSIMYQIGVWVTMLCEGISIAAQSLLSKNLSLTKRGGSTSTTTTTTTSKVSDDDDSNKNNKNKQSTVSSSTSSSSYDVSKLIIHRALQSGLFVSCFVSTLLYFFQRNVISIFTKNVDIQTATMNAMPMFLLAQLAKGLAFPINGVILGGMDWVASMVSMVCANLACFSTLRLTAGTVRGLWMGWAVFYFTQGMVGLARYSSRTGIWREFTPGKDKKSSSS